MCRVRAALVAAVTVPLPGSSTTGAPPADRVTHRPTPRAGLRRTGRTVREALR